MFSVADEKSAANGSLVPSSLEAYRMFVLFFKLRGIFFLSSFFNQFILCNLSVLSCYLYRMLYLCIHQLTVSLMASSTLPMTLCFCDSSWDNSLPWFVLYSLASSNLLVISFHLKINFQYPQVF